MTYWDRFWRMRASRRGVPRGGALAGVGGVGMALVGCGDDDDDPQPTTGATETGGTPAPSNGQPKQGGTLRYPIFGLSSGDPPTLYPYENISYQVQTTAAYHYSRLLRGRAGPDVDSTAYTELEGDLAQGLPEQPDDTTYVFKWKPNVTFHDKAPMNGRAATVQDFLQTWDFFKSSAINASRFTQVVETFEATDDETLTIKLNAPLAPFLVVGAASDQGIYFIPVETINNDQMRTDPVGSGPWVFQSYETGVRMRWARNPNWYDGPAPYFEQIEATLVRDPQRIIASLAAQELDFSSLSAQNLPDVEADLPADGQKVFGKTGSPSAVWFNFDNKPWDDVRVRKALSMALDRQGVMDTLDPTGNEEWNSFFGPALKPYYMNPKDTATFGSGSENFVYDPAESRALLEAAGHLDLAVNIVSNVDRYGPASQQQWEAQRGLINEAGFNAQNVYQEYGAYIQSSYFGQYGGDTSAITMGPLFGTVLDPDDLFLASYWSGSSRHNWGGTPLPEMAALDEMYLKQRTLLDLEERTEYIQDLQRAMADIMVLVPTVNTTGLVYIHPWLQDFNWKATYATAAETHPFGYFNDERLARE